LERLQVTSTLNTQLDYAIEPTQLHDRNESFLSLWRQLLSTSASPEKIYQTPEFFTFMEKTNSSDDRIELFSIRSIKTGQIIGIIPARFRKLSFDFVAGSRNFAAPSINVIVLLGSVPLISVKPELFEYFLAYLFEQYPSCRALSMPTLPRESELLSYIQDSKAISRQYRLHVLQGWRECHAIPLPSSFEQYLQQFSSKKRFNLKRQIRLLQEHGNDNLCLKRIEKPEQIAELIKAIRMIATPELLATVTSENSFIELARQGLLHSYILNCGEFPFAVILATRSDDVLHIHNICYPPELAHMSPGVSILHMAIEDLTNNFKFSSIDLGYSNPGHKQQSSNSIQIRGHLLVLRKTLANRLLCVMHDVYLKQLNTLKEIVENYHQRQRDSKKARVAN
jgi:CelD/BcsL family acetyltransferase involved in cellulose biosynthesis